MIAFLKEFAELLDIKVIIMSATLPNLEVLTDHKENAVRLLSDCSKYFHHKMFRERVVPKYDLLEEDITLESLAEHVLENKNKKVLIEFIKKASAEEFYRILGERVESVFLMTGDSSIQERKDLIEKIKGLSSVILVATQVIEAGVDIEAKIEEFVAEIEKIEKEIVANKKVLEIDYPEDLLESVNRNISRISLGLLILAALLTLISFALINNTIRLAIHSKRFLIHTMTLVGASWSFIRRPFLWKNVWIGVVAAILADLALIGMAYALVKYWPELIELITPSTMLTVMIAVFVFGVIITLMCAFISINKYLRMKASALYYI